jgi:hypothetical protein
MRASVSALEGMPVWLRGCVWTAEACGLVRLSVATQHPHQRNAPPPPASRLPVAYDS